MDAGRIIHDTLNWIGRGGTIAAPPPSADNGERAEVNTRPPQDQPGGNGPGCLAVPGAIAWWCIRCGHDITTWTAVTHHISQGHDVAIRIRGRHEKS